MSVDIDFEKAARFLAAHPAPGRLLHVGVVGAHYYGFPSQDSDLDLKGIHLAPTERLLGLAPSEKSHDVLKEFEGLEHDLTTHEVQQALSLLLRGNGNVLERLTTPLQLIADPAPLEALRALARQNLSRRFHAHYRGFFAGMRRTHLEKPRAKSMLYAYRVALTGIHLLRTGETVADVITLGDEYGFDDLSELVARKQEAGEKSALPAELDAHHQTRWPMLEAKLDEARDHSPLPIEPPHVDAVEDWLISLRLDALTKRP